jgi:hypothetical protein
MKPLTRSLRNLAPLVALLLAVAVAPAANVVLDYTYASGSFFSTGTANGLKARATVQAAADYFTTILTDSLPQVSRPNDYISTASGGSPVTYSWTWETRFDNPSTGSPVSISNPTIPVDEYRIYVGARNLPGSTLGVGGPGGYGSNSGGSYYFQWQLDEIQAIGADFAELLDNRSQGAGNFGRWGGSLTFDTSATWNFDHTVAPAAGQNDLLSVSFHEIGHALGFGTSDEFAALRSGTTFLGLESRAANGNVYATLTAEGGHWADGTTSTVYGGATSQEAAMDPTITTGTRKRWTTLDAAGLADIGWDVVAPGLPGDYNSDNLVNAADYTIWRDSVGTGNVIGSYAEWSTNYGQTAAASGLSVPEPTGGVLLLVGACFAAAARRRA